MKTCKCGAEFKVKGPGKQCSNCRRINTQVNETLITQEVLTQVHKIAVQVSRRTGKFHLVDELDAAALEGVAQAAATWDPEADVPFLPFASIRARGACRDLLRFWYGRPGRSSGPKMEAADIDLDELGAYDSASGVEDSAELLWFRLSMGFQSAAFVERVKEILNTRQWMALCTFMTGDTLQSVATNLGVSESRASQLRKEALDRLLAHRDELIPLDPRAA